MAEQDVLSQSKALPDIAPFAFQWGTREWQVRQRLLSSGLRQSITDRFNIVCVCSLTS